MKALGQAPLLVLSAVFTPMGAPSFAVSQVGFDQCPVKYKQTNKNLRCGNRKGLLGRNDQTHQRMGPKTMESIPPSKRNTQADIQLRTRQTNHQQETDGCIQIKHNPEHQPSRMSSKSTAYVPPKTASTPTKGYKEAGKGWLQASRLSWNDQAIMASGC